jgi:hypothetical protein
MYPHYSGMLLGAQAIGPYSGTYIDPREVARQLNHMVYSLLAARWVLIEAKT